MPPVHSAVRSFSVAMRMQPSLCRSGSVPSGRQSHRSLLCGPWSAVLVSASSWMTQLPRPGWRPSGTAWARRSGSAAAGTSTQLPRAYWLPWPLWPLPPTRRPRTLPATRRRVAELGDRAEAGVAQGAGDELVEGAARHAVDRGQLVAVVHDAVRIDGLALEREPPEGGPHREVRRAGAAAEGACGPVEGHVGRVQRVDQLVQATAARAAAGFLAEQDRAPRGAPGRVAARRAGEDGGNRTGGEVDAHQTVLAGAPSLQ